MTEFDEVSRAIGKIEGRMDNTDKSLAAIDAKLDKIDERLTNHRVKSAGVAGGVTIGLNILLHKLKEIF